MMSHSNIHSDACVFQKSQASWERKTEKPRTQAPWRQHAGHRLTYAPWKPRTAKNAYFNFEAQFLSPVEKETVIGFTSTLVCANSPGQLCCAEFGFSASPLPEINLRTLRLAKEKGPLPAAR